MAASSSPELVFSKSNYLNKAIHSLRSTQIREYDMVSAGFSMIRAHSLLSSKKIEYLESISSDKKRLNIEIGLIRRDNPAFSQKLSDCMRDTVKTFLIENEYTSDELISIKNDAVFVHRKAPAKILEVNGGTFSLDHTFTSYYFLNEIEFYFDSISGHLLVKGLGGETVAYHSEYLLHEFKYLFQQAEISSFADLLEEVKEFKREYLERELDIGCYREMNRNNLFSLIFPNNLNQVYTFKELSEQNVSDELLERLNINFNYIHFIIPLIRLLVV